MLHLAKITELDRKPDGQAYEDAAARYSRKGMCLFGILFTLAASILNSTYSNLCVRMDLFVGVGVGVGVDVGVCVRVRVRVHVHVRVRVRVRVCLFACV